MNPDMVAILDDTPAHHITKCSKDLGTHTRLRHWSRGHVFICRPCGHILISGSQYIRLIQQQ